MNEATFYALISMLNWDATGDDEAVIQPVVDALAGKSFPKDLEFEALLYVAAQAFEKKTGEDYTYSPEPSYETYSNEDGWR